MSYRERSKKRCRPSDTVRLFRKPKPLLCPLAQQASRTALPILTLHGSLYAENDKSRSERIGLTIVGSVGGLTASAVSNAPAPPTSPIHNSLAT
jgi:hypothetical protein